MADFSALKTSIQNYIKQNGNEEITGNLLQQILLSMVTTLGDSAINELVTALNTEVANRGNADTELSGRITTLQGVVNGIKANVDNGYVYAGIATPSTTPASGKVFYLALTAGTYTNFGATVVPQGINILKYNGSAWSLDSFIGLDDAPTQGSNNLVKSGGVLDSIIKDGSAFDLSAYNSGATYADLGAALTALSALPAAYKKGGMSMKFVRTSDNKYVQYFCNSQEFTTDISYWDSIKITDEIARLYPFTTPISNALSRPNYPAQIIYSKSLNGIQYLRITTYSNEVFYVDTLYSYGGSHESNLVIKSGSNKIRFAYTAVRSGMSDRPTETLHLTGTDNESTLDLVIDWKKINLASWLSTANNFAIDESCVLRKGFDTIGDIVRLYPFACKLNSILSRPNYPAQVVYSSDMAGILYLHIETTNKSDFYINTIYSYDGAHKAHLTVRSLNNATVFDYVSEARSSSSQSSFPTETIELTASDGSTLKAIIDWSKTNLATGIGLDNTFTIDEACIHRLPIEEKLCSFIPITDYYVTGEQQRIYLNELAEYNRNGFFDFQVTNNSNREVIAGWNGECQYLQFNASATKDFVVTITYYYQYEEIITHTLTVHAVVASTLPLKKYMFLGDSLTAGGIYEKKFYDMNPDRVTLYGTLGTAPYFNEGRAGWSSSDYMHQSKGGVVNPFYNPNTEAFDFSYYMTNNPSFSDVDCVVIFLGRNDGYAGGLINNINTIITSIKAFNSNIKTYVIGAYNVACNDSGTGRYLQSNSIMNHLGFTYNKNQLFHTFTPQTETKPIPIQLNLDNKYDFASVLQDVSIVDDRKMEVYTDNVHPSSIGYEKFGMAINGFFHYEFRT